MDFLIKILVLTLLNELISGYPTAASTARRKTKANLFDSPLIRYQAQEDTGYYKFGYAVTDGQYRVEEGSPQEGILGSYGYVGTDGNEVKVFYKADSQGFQILTADVYKALREAKKRFHQPNGPIKYFSQKASKNRENDAETVGPEFISENQPEFATATGAEEDSTNRPVTEPPFRSSPEIAEVFSDFVNENRPVEQEVEVVDEVPEFSPKPKQNFFHPTPYPVYFPPTNNDHFGNRVPVYYLPNVRYEQRPYLAPRFRFRPPERHFAPLVIRV